MLYLANLGVVVTLRDWVETTLAEVLHAPEENMQLNRRLSVLDNVLEALEILHSKGLTHGDLRPENIAIRNDGAALFDYSLPVSPDRMSSEQSVYLAPEAKTSKPQQASDVFAFGKLAQRMLGPYLWDNSTLPNGLRSEQIEWVLDFATVANPDDRPTAEEIRQLLSDELPPRDRPVFQSALRIAAMVGAAQYTPSHNHLEVEYGISAAVDEVADRLTQFEETQLAFHSEERAQRLVRWLVVDKKGRDIHNTHHGNRRDAKGRLIALMEAGRRIYPDGIDLPWKDRLHRFYFDGSPVDLGGQELTSARATGERGQAYLAQVALMDKIRSDMLERDTYFHSADVSALMSRVSPVSEADVAVLRRWGDLLAVPDHGRWLYPAFQFHESGAPRRQIAEVNRLFGDDDRWDVLGWWHLPLSSLGGRRLLEVLDTEEGQDAFREQLSRLSGS